MRRRELLPLALGAGAAVAWPRAAGAQQKTMPVVGYLSGRSLSDTTLLAAAFRQRIPALSRDKA